MSHSTFECEQFIYTKNRFERDIMTWIETPSAKVIKNIIDEDFENKPKCLRTAVYKRILNYKNTKCWWIENFELLTQNEREKQQEEMIIIWKLGRNLCKAFYIQRWNDCWDLNDDYDGNNDDSDIQKAIDSYFYNTLAEFEAELEKEEINEQQFITRCNNMKDHKEILGDLLNVCVCSVICRYNKGTTNDEQPTDVLRIMCMPCGFI